MVKILLCLNEGQGEGNREGGEFNMPKKLERRLKRECAIKHPNFSKKRCDAYVYGTLRKTGWKPKRK